MAAPIEVFCLYKLKKAEDSVEKMVLLRVKRPGYSDARPHQEDESFYIERMKTEALLLESAKKFFNEEEISIEHISSFEYLPEGDVLFNTNGMKEIQIWAGHPTDYPDSIIISMAGSEQEFLKFVEGNDDLNFFLPLHKIENHSVFFITENDFDLSAVPKYNYNHLDQPNS